MKNARYYLSRARDIDSENRISEAQNDFLRGLGGPRLLIADVERAFEKQAFGGLIGSELVGDNCHPTPLGFSIMVRSILETLLASGWLGGGEPQGLAKTDWPAYLAGIPPKEQTQFQIRFHFAEAEYGLDSCPRAGGPYTCPYLHARRAAPRRGPATRSQGVAVLVSQGHCREYSGTPRREPDGAGACHSRPRSADNPR